MAAQREGWRATLRDLFGAFKPLAVRRLEQEIEERVAKVPTRLNEFGYDGYGLHTEFIRQTAVPAALFYRHYFRAQSYDIERVPEGRVLLVANHAGQLPFDGMMLSMAMLLDAQPPRIPRAMAEYWVSRLPWISIAAARSGAMVGTPENCVSMLEAGECVAVFPEGVRGLNKPYWKRYELQRFGLGFMRLALETDTPIVPVAFIGSEEQQPGIANFEGLGRLVGMPALPLTAGFLLLGPLGMLPLPVKYHIYFGEPLRFVGDASEDDAAIQDKVDLVKRSINAMFERGLRERAGIFR